MFLSQSKNKPEEKFEKFVQSFGYIHRVGGYYLKREDNGYINVHRESPSLVKENSLIYHFHKNHYQGVNDKNGLHKKDISFSTSDFIEFVNHMDKFHIKESRRKKLNQIENVNRIL